MSSLRPGQRIAREALTKWQKPQLGRLAPRSFATTAATRSTSPAAAAEIEEPIRVADPDASVVESFKTENRLNRRDIQLPGTRYQYHPPKYDRGPLHPVQSPPRSDPIARNFMAGPFNYPRLKQTWEHTVSSDLLALTYLHTPPGTPERPAKERLRKWVGESPYFENRALRGPRGAPNLRLLEQEITPNNIPEIRAVHMDIFYKDGKVPYEKLYIARSVMQAISGRAPRLTYIKEAIAGWGTRKGQNTGCKITIYGDQAVEFVDKLVNLVLPKIKDWPGLKAGGDRSGNVGFGLTATQMGYFPEIETSFDMYPQKSLPGCRFVVETSAKSDRQAMLLLSSLGFPFTRDSFD